MSARVCSRPRERAPERGAPPSGRVAGFLRFGLLRGRRRAGGPGGDSECFGGAPGAGQEVEKRGVVSLSV